MYIADLHIHSKYSRATSKECVPEYLELWARKKSSLYLGPAISPIPPGGRSFGKSWSLQNQGCIP